MNAKVRLRASIIRLNNAGWSAPKLATHFGRNLQSVHNDLNVLDKVAPSGPVRRFEHFGAEGLAEGKAAGAKPKVTPDIEGFMQTKLTEERVWNSLLLGEAVEKQFGIKLGREAVRVKLLELGDSWQRTRSAPGKGADSEVVAEHQASLEPLKKGSWSRSQGPPS